MTLCTTAAKSRVNVWVTSPLRDTTKDLRHVERLSRTLKRASHQSKHHCWCYKNLFLIFHPLWSQRWLWWFWRIFWWINKNRFMMISFIVKLENIFQLFRALMWINCPINILPERRTEACRMSSGLNLTRAASGKVFGCANISID